MHTVMWSSFIFIAKLYFVLSSSWASSNLSSIKYLFWRAVSLLNDDVSPFTSSQPMSRPVYRHSYFDVSCCITVSHYMPADAACQHAAVSDLPVFMSCISVGKAPFIPFPSISLTTFTCLKWSSVCLITLTFLSRVKWTYIQSACWRQGLTIQCSTQQHKATVWIA